MRISIRKRLHPLMTVQIRTTPSNFSEIFVDIAWSHFRREPLLKKVNFRSNNELCDFEVRDVKMFLPHQISVKVLWEVHSSDEKLQ